MSEENRRRKSRSYDHATFLDDKWKPPCDQEPQEGRSACVPHDGRLCDPSTRARMNPHWRRRVSSPSVGAGPADRPSDKTLVGSSGAFAGDKATV
jgi:hypothetical protein